MKIPILFQGQNWIGDKQNIWAHMQDYTVECHARKVRYIYTCENIKALPMREQHRSVHPGNSFLLLFETNLHSIYKELWCKWKCKVNIAEFEEKSIYCYSNLKKVLLVFDLVLMEINIKRAERSIWDMRRSRSEILLDVLQTIKGGSWCHFEASPFVQSISFHATWHSDIVTSWHTGPLTGEKTVVRNTEMEVYL